MRLIGVVSFFADFTYEGSRAITGPFLAILGASGTVVDIVAGLGELLGYGLRLVSGRLSERTQKFWPITLFGYVIQMLSVPSLALPRGTWLARCRRAADRGHDLQRGSLYPGRCYRRTRTHG